MQALPLGDLSTTPWSFSPLWFVLMALAIPGFVWLALAWRRALLECPNRVRRAGVKEMRRLLKSLQRSGGTPRPADLHAWLRASARAWDVRTSAPCASEVSQAAHTLTGDESVSLRWRELWLSTEHGLYSADAALAPDWLERAASATAAVDVPKRERMFPNRLRDWLPFKPAHNVAQNSQPNGQLPLHWRQAGGPLAVALFVFTFLPSPATDADVPWSSPPPTAEPASSEAPSGETALSEAALAESPSREVVAEPLPPEVQRAANAALDANWNDWAAHHNLAAYQIQQGDLNLAIAHATSAFVQHPAAATTRDTLLAAFGETQTIDPNLHRLLRGAWYERAPTLLSAAAWQRMALIAGLIAAAGLCVMVIAMYVSNEPFVPSALAERHPTSAMFQSVRPLANLAFAASAMLLAVAIAGWNAYGELNQPAAAILTQNASLSPVPTDLVPVEETSPLAAGKVVVTQRTFLSWLEISNAPNTSGWIRSNAVMPLYAGRQPNAASH